MRSLRSKYALLPLLIARADVGLSIAQLITNRQLENRVEMGNSSPDGGKIALELSQVISSNYDIDNLIRLFATVPVFSELTKQEELLRTVAAHSSLERFSRGCLVVEKDEPGQSMYIVRSGTLRVRPPAQPLSSRHTAYRAVAERACAPSPTPSSNRGVTWQ